MAPIHRLKYLARVTKVFTDDMNDDGRPDLVICVYSGDNNEIGTIVAYLIMLRQEF